MEQDAMFSTSHNLYLSQLDHITPKKQRLQDFFPQPPVNFIYFLMNKGNTLLLYNKRSRDYLFMFTELTVATLDK